MSNDIENPTTTESAYSDGLIYCLYASLATMIVFLLALFVFACFHPILFIFPGMALAALLIFAVLGEIAARL